MVAAAKANARVIVMDRSADAREVLHTLLESRGVTSLEVASVRDGLQLVRENQPTVIVIDGDACDVADDFNRQSLEDHANDANATLVVLGRLSVPIHSHSPLCFVAKPYHYGPLLRTIQRLLEQ